MTICMNGMHSTRKIKERYPGYLPIIRELYTGFFNERYLSCHAYGMQHTIWYESNFRKIAHNSTVKRMLNDVLYDQFMNDTSNDFIILGCRYMRIVRSKWISFLWDFNEIFESMGCIGNWTVEYTRFGKCAVFNPDAEQIGNVSFSRS